MTSEMMETWFEKQRQWEEHFMREQYDAIGETAGKIYQTLEKNGPTSDSALKKEIQVSDNTLFEHAIGWLAREGKISFQRKGKGYVFSLALEPAQNN